MDLQCIIIMQMYRNKWTRIYSFPGELLSQEQDKSIGGNVEEYVFGLYRREINVKLAFLSDIVYRE